MVYLLIKGEKIKANIESVQKADALKYMIGGDMSYIDIKDKYYLCTQTRYDKPITDFLRPFGSFKDLEKLYSENEINWIKELYFDIKDVKGIGTSQYGLYFRLVKKSLIDDIYTINKPDNESIKNNTRSFVFDIEQLLKYLIQIGKEKTYSVSSNIPLFFFSDCNAYGYQSYARALFDKNSDINRFLNEIGNYLYENLYDHELVSRLPIPLSDDSGFLGVITDGILGFEYYDQDYINYKTQMRIDRDRLRCKDFNNNENKCKKNGCWYYRDSKKCGPHLTKE